MSRVFLPLPLLLLACDPSSPVESIAAEESLALAEPSAFRAELAEGHTADEHAEVAPGVYLLRSAMEAGKVRYVAQEEQAARRSRPSAESCYNYSDDNYTDELSGGSMFNGNPSWYGVSNAVSYYYDGPGTRGDQDYEQVSAYLWGYNDRPVWNISVTAYVYVNGDYVGYISDNARNGTTALQYGVFDATCEDGVVSVETYHYHSWSDRSGEQYLYLMNRTSAASICCP